MSKGDFAEVTYRTGAGVEKVRIRARSNGASVVVTDPKPSALFVEVQELNKVGEAVQTSRFARNEVVAIVEGHDDGKTATKVTKIKVQS